jgi:putative ABC transport system permease protein
MKAIGAQQMTVLKMFVIEAAIIGFMGGVIGLAIGSLSSFLLSELPMRALPAIGRLSTRILPALTFENLTLSFVLGFATGTLAGLYPAWRAARMRTVEALRHV